MKKVLVTILMMTLIASIILTGCSGATKTSGKDTSLEDVKKAGKMVIGLDDAFAPMGFRDENNNIVGFDVDLAKEAAKRMGVEPEFKPIAWESKEMELNSKKIDVIWNGLTITEERKKNMAFTDPYLENTQIIIVVKGSAIKGKADLAGKKVGVQTESSSQKAVEKDQDVFKSLEELVTYDDNLKALMDLKTGRIDAVVADEILGRYYIVKKPGEYEVLKENFGEEEYGIGLRLGDKALLDELQRVMNEMKEDGTAATISEKWFGENIVK